MGVLAPTVMVMVELPLPGAGMGLGLKLTVVPVGTPELERAMELLNPPLMVVVMVDVPLLPCCTLNEAGEAEMVKLGSSDDRQSNDRILLDAIAGARHRDGISSRWRAAAYGDGHG